VTSIDQAAEEADVIMILAPDTEQQAIYRSAIEPHLRPGDAIAFAHGFNVRFGLISAPEGVDVIMIAPKGPGHLVRRTYEGGGGVPALIAVEQDASGKARELALSYASAIGATRAGVLDTTFAEETETDLFGEQVVLCGGLTSLIPGRFRNPGGGRLPTRVRVFRMSARGQAHVDLMYEHGISGMRYSISTTAEYGDLTRGPRIINDATKAEMRKILEEIRSGQFAAEWIKENKDGLPNYKRLEAAGAEHQVEKVGAQLRAMIRLSAPDPAGLRTFSGADPAMTAR